MSKATKEPKSSTYIYRYNITCLPFQEEIHIQPDRISQDDLSSLDDNKLVLGFDGFIKKHCKFNNQFPLTLGKMCEKCYAVPITKHHSTGVTTLENIRYPVHYYTFDIIPGDEANKYECVPGIECIKYRTDEKFYHLAAKLGGGETSFQMGFLHSDTIIQQLLDSLYNLKVPYFNSANIKSVDQLINKMKIYNLFS